MRRSAAACLLPGWVALLATGLCLTSPWQLSAADPPPARRPQISDQELANRLAEELQADPGVRAGQIEVDSQDGVVSLTGQVDHLLAKRRAARIAGTIRGVRSVVNRLQVQASESRKDEEIRADVIAALKVNPATEAFEVEVQVQDGIVTLDGQVDSYQERELAKTIAASVRGVAVIRDQLSIARSESRADSELETEIRSALRWCVHIDHNLVDVQVDDGQVKLAGAVGSAAEKSEAIGKAWVQGVRSVDAGKLHVERWARDPDLRGDKWRYRSVSDVTAAIEDALRIDPRVDEQQVTVQVLGAAATLRGQVDNLQAKQDPAQDARNTVGVTSVMNRLQVQPRQQRADGEVVVAVREAIERDPYLNRFEMKFMAIDGTVTLYGAVDSRFEQQRATQVASEVRGVVEVDNRIAVEQVRPYLHQPYIDERVFDDAPRRAYQSPASDEADAGIRKAIQDEYRWSPFVNAEQIEVAVHRGVATLTGKVETLAESRAATNNAYQGGATWVENKLEIASAGEADSSDQQPESKDETPSGNSREPAGDAAASKPVQTEQQR